MGSLCTCAPKDRDLAPVELISARGVRVDAAGTPRLILDASTLVVLRGEGELAPVLTSTFGAAGTLKLAKKETRAKRQLAWFELADPKLGAAVLKIGEQKFPVVIDRPLSAYAQLAGLPQSASERGAAIDRVLPAAGGSFRLAMLVERARLSQRTGRPEETVAAWMELAREADKASEPSMITYGLRSAAYVDYFERRNFSTGDEALARADVIDQRIDFVAGSVRSAFQRGVAARQRGLHREAEAALRDAYERGWAHGLDRDAAFALRALGPLLQDQGRYHESLAVLEEAAPAFRASREPRDQLWYENDLAWALLRGGAEQAFPLDADRIRTLEARALELAEKLELKEEQAGILANLAWLEALSADRARALELCARARRLAPDRRSFSSLFLTLLEGTLALEGKDAETAEVSFLEAERMAIEEAPGGTSDALWRALHGQAKVARAKKDKAKAGALYERALFALERSALAAGFEGGRGGFLGDRSELARDAERFFEEQSQLGRAFEISSRFRAHFYRAMELEGAPSRLEPVRATELSALEREYQAVRKREETQARALALAPQSELEEMKRALAAIRAEARALVDRRIELLAGKIDALDVAAIQRALGPESALLDFSRDGAGARIFYVTSKRIETVATSSAADAARAMIGAGIRHVFVVAGDVDEALRIATPDLIQRSTIAHLPHAGTLLQKREVPGGSPLIAGDPQSNLPGARAEAIAVAKRFSAPTLWLGQDVRREKLLDALDGRSIFHFAGHGKLGGAFDARLELAAGETLRISDVFARRARLGLVVLSGCETGASSKLGRAHAIALPESFFVAGASAVLAATDAIADEAARAFVLDFYAEGGDRAPIDAYARAARKYVAKNDASWRSFRVVGLP